MLGFTKCKIGRFGVVLLFNILYFGGLAALHKVYMRSSNCQCFLDCDGAKLKDHKSVHVLIELQSESVVDKKYPVSSLYEDSHCAVPLPDCSAEESQFTMNIYADDNQPVPSLLYKKTDLKPDCDPETLSFKSNKSNKQKTYSNAAAGILSNTLLILSTLCISIFFLNLLTLA